MQKVVHGCVRGSRWRSGPAPHPGRPSEVPAGVVSRWRALRGGAGRRALGLRREVDRGLDRAFSFGKSCASLAHWTPSTVISRPPTSTFVLATRTKRFTSWKKSARLKKSPTNSSSSGTVSRPGGGRAGGVRRRARWLRRPTASPPLSEEVEVCVSVALTPDCSAFAAVLVGGGLRVVGRLHGGAGALCAVSPPAATGRAGAEEPSVVRWSRPPGRPRSRGRRWRSCVKGCPCPAAARSSCTIRLGMSTLAGMALPRRTTSVKSDSKAFSALFAESAACLRRLEAGLLLGELVGGLGGLVALRPQDQEPVGREDHAAGRSA